MYIMKISCPPIPPRSLRKYHPLPLTASCPKPIKNLCKVSPSSHHRPAQTYSPSLIL
jgi:hypothetical protein